MKKNYFLKAILLVFFGFALTYLHSQAPVITDLSSLDYGDKYNIMSSTTTVNPNDYLNAGENQIWDFSGLSFTNSGTLEIINPTDVLELHTQFPTANLAFKVTMEENISYQVFNLTPQYFYQLGKGLGFEFGSWEIYNSPGRLELQFPFNYQNTFTDPETQTVTTYDAYGTVILPGLTIQNMARTNNDYTGNDWEFHWFHIDEPFSQVVLNESGRVMYFDEITQSVVNNKKEEIEFNIFPNPSNSEINLNYAVSKKQDVRIDIYDLTGKLIANVENAANQRGNHYLKINNLNLDKGIYMVKMQTSDNYTIKSFIKY